MSHFMQNLNGHVMCAIDTETTGEDPDCHEIIQIAVIPLDTNLKPMNDVMPFYVDMIPRYPERANLDAMSINKLDLAKLCLNGFDRDRAADLFIDWIDRLRLPIGKRIIPLGCNWPFDRDMIRKWLGAKTFNLYFDAQYRDVMSFAASTNDIAGWRGMDFPYAKTKLSFLANLCNVERSRAHDALEDARCTAEVYRSLLTQDYLVCRSQKSESKS